MHEDLHVTHRLVIPSSELAERFSRSSGPGGQGVNTTDSRVELSFDLGASPVLSEQQRERACARLRHRLAGGILTVVAAQERSQLANRRQARQRLAALLSEAVTPPAAPRRPTKPSKRARQRATEGKKHRSKLKQQRKRGDPGES